MAKEDTPPHTMYEFIHICHAPQDYAGEYDETVTLRCDCGADRSQQPDQCTRCGDTKPPELR